MLFRRLGLPQLLCVLEPLGVFRLAPGAMEVIERLGVIRAAARILSPARSPVFPLRECACLARPLVGLLHEGHVAQFSSARLTASSVSPDGFDLLFELPPRGCDLSLVLIVPPKLRPSMRPSTAFLDSKASIQRNSELWDPVRAENLNTDGLPRHATEISMPRRSTLRRSHATKYFFAKTSFTERLPPF